MTDWMKVGLWTFAGIALVLGVQTFVGNGSGFAETHMMASMAWSYVVLLLGVLVFGAAFLLRSNGNEQDERRQP